MSQFSGQSNVQIIHESSVTWLSAAFFSSAGAASASASSSAWYRGTLEEGFYKKHPELNNETHPKKTCTFKTAESHDSFLRKVHVSFSRQTSSYSIATVLLQYPLFSNQTWKPTSFWWCSLFFRFCLLFRFCLFFLFLSRLVMVGDESNILMSWIHALTTQNMAIESALWIHDIY